MAIVARAALLLVAGLAACNATDSMPPTQQGPSGSSTSAGASTLAVASMPAVARGPAVMPPPGCPVTLPGSAGEPPFRGATFGGGTAYGNSTLWVGLYSGGVIAAPPGFVEPDGSVRMKFGWYRIAEGKLSITGRRLDGTAAPLRADVPDGYGASGFQATGLFFPAVGCWEVTGQVGAGSMTFVVYVVKVPG